MMISFMTVTTTMTITMTITITSYIMFSSSNTAREPWRNIIFKGWNSHVHGEFPGKFESSNVRRDNVSREIGRSSD